MKLDILITLLKTDIRLDGTWKVDDEHQVLFFNRHKELVGMAFYEKDSLGYEKGLIEVIGPAFSFGWAKAEAVYSYWVNYIMRED